MSDLRGSVRLGVLVISVAALAGCVFIWNGPAEIRLTNGSRLSCASLLTERAGVICYQKDSNVRVSWGLIAGLDLR